MHAEGIAVYERRDESRTINYSSEMREATLGPAYEKRFKANAKAWAFFISQAPSYQRHAKFWVTTAKQEATRERRLEILIADSAAGRRLAVATPGKNKKNPNVIRT